MSEPPDPQPPPTYTKYRSRPKLLDRGGGDRLERLRTRPGRERDGDGAPPAAAPGARRAGRVPWRRVLTWLVLAVVGWLTLSLVLFLVSAQLQRDPVSDEAEGVLAGGGRPPFSATTILVLGSDQRTEANAEPGASTSGPSRSDSILLMRIGGGRSARLSIPRDTVVDIPGHGRDKVNAAYALGGPALAVRTVEEDLDVPVDHLVEVSFDNFPDLIDAMGGIDYTGGCVVSRINGGARNGGTTLRLPAGTSHLDGDEALALARTRSNACNPRENDLTRARRQQKIFAAMKDRLVSPFTFVRLPLVSWAAPKAIRTDMGGLSLLGLFTALATGGAGSTQVLEPSGDVTLPNGGSGLLVPEAEKRREVRRLLGD